MRKAPLLFLACLSVCIGSKCALAGSTPGIKQIKQQQKMQRRQLKAEQKIWKRSFRGRNIPRAERLTEKHEFQRNMRNLRLQQKDRIQQLKDEERVTKYRRSHPLY